MRLGLVFFLFLLAALLAFLPTDALQVIGAGFGRTGTDSLREALEQLGYPCYHMKVIIDNNTPQDFALWTSFFRGERQVSELVDELFDVRGYTAAVDFPASGAWKELAKLYPDAKIILTERASPEVWWESAKDTVLGTNIVRRLLFRISPFFRQLDKMVAAMSVHIGIGTIEEPRRPRWDDREKVIKAYIRNSEEARTLYPNRTLIFDVRQGWEPLCQFLGKDVPEMPFPHLNTRAEFHKMNRGLFAVIVVPPLLILMAFIAFIKLRSSKSKAVAKND